MRRLCLLIGLIATTSVHTHELKVFVNKPACDRGAKITSYLSWGHLLPIDELIDAKTLERYEFIDPIGKSEPLNAEGVSLQATSFTVDRDGVYTVVVRKKPSVNTYIINEAGEREFKRGPKTDHADKKIDSSKRSLQTAKAMIVVGQPSTTVPAPVGLPLEIVPVSPSADWVVGKKIQFKVLLDGKPAADVDVVARDVGFKPDDAWAYATDSDKKGIFTLQTERPGTWVIKINHKKPAAAVDKAQFDEESLTATLSLEVRR